MDLFEAIKNRRSIRRYKPDPVDDKKIEAILEAGPLYGAIQGHVTQRPR